MIHELPLIKFVLDTSKLASVLDVSKSITRVMEEYFIELPENVKVSMLDKKFTYQIMYYWVTHIYEMHTSLTSQHQEWFEYFQTMTLLNHKVSSMVLII